MTEDIELLIEGGKATGGPPLGPALGPMGVNLMEVVNAINEKTKSFAGMQVPVKVKIDMKTKSFDIVVGTPPASALIKKELGIEKGSGHCSTKKAGDLKLEQVKKLAEMEIDKKLRKASLSVEEKYKFFDWTMPGDGKWIGHLHPLIQTMD
jgi:large subunit ribosomal protein L11